MSARRDTTRENYHAIQGAAASVSMTEPSPIASTLAEPPRGILADGQSPADSRGFGSPSVHVIKVLHVVESLDVGGTETQMVQIAQHLDPRVYHVTVACLHSGGPLTEPLQAAGIEILEFPKRVTFVSFQAIYQLLRLARYIRHEKIQVVHAHHLPANLMAVPAAWLAGAPVILSSLRNLAHLPWYTPFRRKVVRLIYRLSTGVIANSEAVRQLLVTEFQVPPSHVHLLYNGVDYGRFAQCRGDRQKLHPSLQPGTKLILNLANMNSEVKGHAILIEAARAVCAAIPDARFALVGDGALRSNLEQRVKALGLEQRILFLGRRKDVPEILSCGDLFVLPSLAEGLPNSVLEAMSAGLPVVATAVGGIPEIIEDGVSGLLAPPNDSQAITEAILRALRDPALAAKLARAGQARARSEFSFDRVLTDLRQIYTAGPRRDSEILTY
jgi:glycosyltransferase involved in cell wall biosynthesis